MTILQAEIEGENIYSFMPYGQRTLLGRTESAYTAMANAAEKATAKAEEYYKELLEAGLRQPEKTQEQINQELMAQVAELTAELQAIRRENGPTENKGNSNDHGSKKRET